MFVGCARKHEQSKKDVVKELFSEIGVFLVKKGSIKYDITSSKDMENRKNSKIMVDD